MSHRLLRTVIEDLALDPVVPERPAGRGPSTAREFHRRLPDYVPTPLRSVPELAARLGVGEVHLKLEAERFGLPSYKILGASWASYRAILDAFLPAVRPWEALTQFTDQLGPPAGRGLVAATDGNHGRAVARTAAWVGWSAHILVPRGTADARIAGIESEGATVTVVDGSYDEAVERAAELADDRTLVISDTAWPGYQDVPTWVIEGYSTIFAEIDELVDGGRAPRPTHVVVPVGVGALAAATVDRYRTGPDRSELIGVEPSSAACVMASVAAGTEVEVPGPHPSMMAGLNCGRPSPLAFPRLVAGFGGWIAIDDRWSAEATVEFARHGVAVGESAAAGLGGLLALTVTERAALGLDAGSRVLLVLTEGVTDPRNFRDLVGAALAEELGVGP